MSVSGLAGLGVWDGWSKERSPNDDGSIHTEAREIITTQGSFQHTERVGTLAAEIAARLALEPAQVATIRKAAPLHDIGKFAIPDGVLLKRGPLTDAERATMQTHAVIGAQLLSGSRSPVLQMAAVIAASHHERWDGRGYPARLSGESIPLVGRIVAVADVFDALTHARPYKQAWPVERALREILLLAGTHFDPRIVAAFTATRVDTIPTAEHRIRKSNGSEEPHGHH